MFPELIAPGRPWKVEVSDQPRVDIKGRRMYLLPPGEESMRSVSRHEMGHAMFSPSKHPKGFKSGLLQECLQVVEDARINLWLERVGLGQENQPTLVAEVAAACQEDPRTASLMAIAWLGNADNLAAFLAALPRDGRALASRIAAFARARLTLRWRKRKASPPAFERVPEIAKEIALLLGWKDEPDPIPIPPMPYPKGGGTAEVGDDGSGGISAPIPSVDYWADDGSEKRPVPLFQPRWPKMQDYHAYADSFEELGPVPMSIELAALRHNQDAFGGKGDVRKTIPSVDGDIPRFPHRLLVDGAIFRRRRKLSGGGTGTVLVDVSGSMSFSDRQVHEIIRTVPAATVAVYSGYSAPGRARLIIVAQGGRTVSRSAYPKGLSNGNVCDESALAWLGTQATPRIWLCDGGVTSWGDAETPTHRAFCRNLQAKHGIKRADQLSEVLEIFSGESDGDSTLGGV